MRLPPNHLIRARPRLVWASAAGLVAFAFVPIDGSWLTRALIGWNVASYLYLLLMWVMMMRAEAKRIRELADLLDDSAVVVLSVVSIGAVMSLLAILFELATASGTGHRGFHLALTAVTVVGSWFLIPTIFTMHYAHLYYRKDDDPIPLAFPDKPEEPDFWDFAYFAFTIAVASQTADISLRTNAMRKTVLAQAVLSFLFNASIVALSVNIAAGLAAGGH